MDSIFADRVSDVPRSFIREILKVAADSSIISLAGGLPSRKLFPLNEIKVVTNKLLDEAGADVLQYSSTEGYYKLREWIANRYKVKNNLTINPDNILITTGSQQGLDLLGKTFLNEGDSVIIEEPGYLGAIQVFSLYKSVFRTVPLNEDGVDLVKFKEIVDHGDCKLFYCVPNFQNPSGITYSKENREKAAAIVKGKNILIVEDDPYGELRFLGESKPSFYEYVPENTVLLGSFSKTVVPSFRIGWIVVSDDIMERIIVAKQASDLHTNYFGQRIIYEYLQDYNIEDHISKIKKAYGAQRQAMVEAIEDYFPEEVRVTKPEGGMFLWVTLPEGMSAMKAFEKAIERKVAFVPGDPFYVDKQNVNTLRLNFSSVDEETIREGIKRLGQVFREII